MSKTESQHTLPPPPPYVHVVEKKQSFLNRLAWGIGLHVVFNPGFLFTAGPVVLGFILWIVWGIETRKPGADKPVISMPKDFSLPGREEPPAGEPLKPKFPKLPKPGLPGPIDDVKVEVLDAIKAQKDKHAAEEREKAIIEAAKLGIKVVDDQSTADIKAEIARVLDGREREALFNELTRYRYGCDPSLPTPALRDQAAMVRKFMNEQPDYQLKLRLYEKALDQWRWNKERGDNARCPRCKNPFRSRAEGKHNLRCLRCQANFSAGMARACWTTPPKPMEPAPPQMHKGFLGWILGADMKRLLFIPILALPLFVGELPALYRMEVATCLGVAALYSFTAFRVRLPSWVMRQEFRGVVFVACGCVALWIPAQFLIAAYLVGRGARMVMDGDFEESASGDIVKREDG